LNIVLPTKLRQEILGLNIKVGQGEEGLEAETFSIDIRTLDRPKLDEFYAVLQKYPDARTARVHINAYKRGLDSPKGAKVETLRAAAGAMVDYLVDQAIEGWLFKIDDNPIAALVTGIEFYPAIKKRDYEQEAYIQIRMIQNQKGKTERVNFDIKASEAGGQTIAAMLRNKGWQKETEELHQLYQEELVRFKEIRPMYGQQLQLRTSRTHTNEDPDQSYWERKRNNRRKTEVDLLKDNAGRLVHDDEIEEGQFSVKSYSYSDPDNPYIQPGLQAALEQKLGEDTKAFSKAPHLMVFRCYHLGQHVDLDVHVREVEKYTYDTKIRQRLILPDMYNEVLDVLTDDMSLVQEDIVRGKTGGTVILLCGMPGLGKTLTAEVYAEFREVPLLRVHSGQLGTQAAKIEESLLHFYQKAADWGCPVLIDECDVFVRSRGDSLEQNAVVAVFLRTLEYQANTIFLTTNRKDSIDDAVLSRASAIVTYDYPEHKELREIWQTQRNQLLPNLSDTTIHELSEWFKKHDKKMSGRDVKNILRLAARYETSGRAVDLNLLILCAGFRGI